MLENLDRVVSEWSKIFELKDRKFCCLKFGSRYVFGMPVFSWLQYFFPLKFSRCSFVDCNVYVLWKGSHCSLFDSF